METRTFVELANDEDGDDRPFYTAENMTHDQINNILGHEFNISMHWKRETKAQKLEILVNMGYLERIRGGYKFRRLTGLEMRKKSLWSYNANQRFLNRNQEH